MSTDIRWRQRFSNFEKALAQLEEAVSMEKYSKLETQGLIKCFEYTIELAWKTLQDIIHANGYADINGPRRVLRKAFAEGYITDDEGWMTMWDDRLATTHTYDESSAIQIALKIKEKYFGLLDELDKRLKQEPDLF